MTKDLIACISAPAWALIGNATAAELNLMRLAKGNEGKFVSELERPLGTQPFAPCFPRQMARVYAATSSAAAQAEAASARTMRGRSTT